MSARNRPTSPNATGEHPASTARTPVEHLDLATVLEVSQAVSGETDLGKLISTVMRLGLKHAGAVRGLLILPQADAYRIEAEAGIGRDAVTVALRPSRITAADLPQSAFQDVLRTKECVLLHDASAQNPFSGDEYIRKHRARSVLCMPMLRDTRLVGVIYFENNLTSGVFTSARMALLKLLASVAAISVENACLYRDLQEREARVLRESERASHLIVDTIPGLVATLTPAGAVDGVNDQLVEYCGQPLEVMREWGTNGTVHPDDMPGLIEIFGPAIMSGEPYDFEARIRRYDGVYRWFQVRGLPLRDTSGQIARWYVLLADVDDRKRAEHAILSSERNLKLIVDTIPALAWSARPDGSADFFNQHYLDFVGFSSEQASDFGWMVAVHPDDLHGLGAAWKRIWASEAPGEAEARLRRQDGVYRWFLFRANPLRNDKGSVVQWYGINTDIEDRKQAEAGLRRAYDGIADSQRLSRTGNFTADIVADNHTWSPELYRIFEIDPATSIKVQAVRGAIHPEDLPSFDAGFARSLDGTDFDLVFRIVTPSGIVKHVHATGRLIELAAGRPLFIGAIQDVTERMVASEALNKARSDLAHVARVATVSALTASIAHEVNQPLAGIITNAGTCLRMLDANPPNIDGARETARRTIRDGNRAADVVARLRDLFSKKEYTLGPMDLNEATREVIALSLSELQRNRVIVQSELGENLPLVTGDRVQLQQVILNLIRNASDAMVGVDDRPRQLLVRTGRTNGDCVDVTVRDAGVGLEGQSMDKLFDHFHTTKIGGMGIGLSISRTIVERHHGRLWAEANHGPGATFSFSVPCAPVSASPLPPAHHQ